MQIVNEKKFNDFLFFIPVNKKLPVPVLFGWFPEFQGDRFSRKLTVVKKMIFLS